jgi:hypothetical protein
MSIEDLSMRREKRMLVDSIGPLLATLAVLATGCGGGSQTDVVRASDIPVAYTPLPGGYGDTMPAPILARCTEPLVPEAPDLRGLWRTRSASIDGEPVPPGHPILEHVERVEQCGDRVIVTSSGVIHDMRADGTLENGVHDVSAINFQPIQVVATFEDGALVLRPVGLDGFEVTRAREGAEMVWHYGPDLTVLLERIDG